MQYYRNLPYASFPMKFVPKKPSIAMLSLGVVVLLSYQPSSVPSPPPTSGSSHDLPSFPIPDLPTPMNTPSPLFFPVTWLALATYFSYFPCVESLLPVLPPLMAPKHNSSLALNRGHRCGRDSSRWNNLGSPSVTCAMSSAHRATLNYYVAMNPKTRKRNVNLEARARAFRGGVSSEEVFIDFTWIPDPTFSRAREDLFTRAIDLLWQMKTLLDLAM